MTKALLLENPHENADEIFLSHGIEVERIPHGLDENELIEALKGVDILGIRSKTTVSEKVLDAAEDLQAIGAFCIGTNEIATEAAAQRGIAVFNAPYSNTRSVVELAIAEIIALTRRLTVRNSKLHRGIWEKSADQSHEVRGRTLGIIGYGNIGTQLSVLAEALGMRVVFYDITEKLALGNAQRLPSLEAVLSQADVVSIHVDGAQTNANLFGDREFKLMKPGALFINLSRGFIVDMQALRDHLVNGHLGGAAVDVFPAEPKANGDPFQSRLAGLDNVILTPHVGGSTIEAQKDIANFVSHKIQDYLATGSTDMSVNLPNLALPASATAPYRLCFIHRNQPGVMARFNKVFAHEEVNVEGQSLATSGEVGYAVTDLSSPVSPTALELLATLDEAILLRYIEKENRG